MPKITNFAFCDKASIEENQLQAVNFLQVIEPISGRLAFSILFSITGFTASEDHTGYVVFSDPKGEKLVTTDIFTFEKAENVGIEADRLVTGISMGVEFGDVLFQGYGLYKTEIFFDDNQLGEFFIPVIAEIGSDD